MSTFRFPRLAPMETIPHSESPEECRIDDWLEVQNQKDRYEFRHTQLPGNEGENSVLDNLPDQCSPEESLAVLTPKLFQLAPDFGLS